MSLDDGTEKNNFWSKELTQQCHGCGTVENLKAFMCNGHRCGRGKDHATSICKECWIRTTEFKQSLYDSWDKLTYHWKPKYAELDTTKMWTEMVPYYIKKGKTLAQAEEIVKQKIREQQQLRGIVPT